MANVRLKSVIFTAEVVARKFAIILEAIRSLFGQDRGMVSSLNLGIYKVGGSISVLFFDPSDLDRADDGADHLIDEFSGLLGSVTEMGFWNQLQRLLSDPERDRLPGMFVWLYNHDDTIFCRDLSNNFDQPVQETLIGLARQEEAMEVDFFLQALFGAASREAGVVPNLSERKNPGKFAAVMAGYVRDWFPNVLVDVRIGNVSATSTLSYFVQESEDRAKTWFEVASG